MRKSVFHLRGEKKNEYGLNSYTGPEKQTSEDLLKAAWSSISFTIQTYAEHCVSSPVLDMRD